MKNKKQILITLVSVIVILFSVAIITSAVTTVGNDVSVGGDFAVSGNATTTGNQVISGNLNVHGAFSPDNFTFNPAGIFTVSGTTTLATTTATYLTVSNNGIFNNKVGIGTASPSTPIYIGSSTLGSQSVDAQIVVAREITSGSGNAHAFSDSTWMHGRTGTIAWNSFDARAVATGGVGVNYDHYAGFQSAPTFSQYGNLTNYYGFASAPTMNNSTQTLSNAYGVYVSDMNLITGILQNEYGVYVSSLINASTTYAIYTAGNTKSYFGGNVGIGTSTPAYNLEVSSSASTTVMIGSGALTGCLGIGDTDKAGITWCTALDGTLTCSSVKPQQCK